MPVEPPPFWRTNSGRVQVPFGRAIYSVAVCTETARTVGLRRHIAILRPAAPLIVSVVSLAIAIAFVVSLLLPRIYESRATLYVGQALSEPQLDYNGLLASQILTQTYGRLATTRPVLAAVIQDQHLQSTPEELQANVSTEIPLEGTLLVIVARSSDPETAAGIANSVAQQLLAQAPKDDPAEVADRKARLAQLDSTIARIEAEANKLRGLATLTAAQSERLDLLGERLVTFGQARAAVLAEMRAGSPNALTLVDPAIAPTSPVAPSRVLIVGVTGVVALALVVLLVYVLDAFRPEDALGLSKRKDTQPA
jgi:capsular polysaccharide biosynthesis protein